jgi:hypothetical protein
MIQAERGVICFGKAQVNCSTFCDVADLRLAAIHQIPGVVDRIQANKSLLNVVLLNQLPDYNAQDPAILSAP